MPVPYTFASATTDIPLSQLDSNFATTITLGNTAIQLGNTVGTLNNMTLANVTISSVASTIPNSYLANSSSTIGNTAVTLGSTVTSIGNLTLNNATLTIPALGTPASGNLTNCTVDGTNQIGYRDLPAVGTKTGSYTLATGDVGKYVQVGSGGSITIPDATFAEGDIISIFNNTTGNITITCSITTAYIAGTDTDKASVALATRGVASVLFISGTVCVITGNVS